MDVRGSRRARRYVGAVCGLMLVVTSCSSAAGDSTTSTAQPAASSTTNAAPSTTVPPTTTAATTTTTTTTATLPPPTTVAPLDVGLEFQFEILDPNTPVLTKGDWDSRFAYAPWVVFHDDQFHLFYSGWDNSDVAIGYAVADDGVAFTKVGDGPVLEWQGEEGGNAVKPNAPVVYVAADGTWVMYFSELVRRAFLSPSIRRATAPAPEGPWTVDEDPIYTAGEDQWDEEAVPQSVVVTDDEVLLFYDGRTGRTAETGLLRSPDGVNFTVHDDPATPYGADPVLGIPGIQAWDGNGAGSPMAIAGDGYLEMFYLGFLGPTRGDRTVRLGYARSDDGGASWGRLPANPVIDLTRERGSPASLGYPWMGAVKVGDVYYIYYAITAGADGIGLVTGTITEG